MDEYIAQIEREAIQLIDRAESAGQAWLSGVSSAAEQVATLMPELAAAPFANLVPKPADVVKASFDVADKLLDASRKLSEGFVDAMAPVMTALMPWMNGKAGKRADRKGAASQSREAA